MAIVTQAVRNKMARDAAYERELRGLKRQAADEMVVVPFEWQTQQTDKAVKFRTYGWVPKVCIAWERNGQRLPWSLGGEGDQFLIARRFVPAA